jgi:hypothetical protein
MSPEQVRGGVLDGRSDLFSLAVVLYEALSGKRPFHGDDLVSLAYSIAHDTQVPLSRQLQSCPADLDKFFDRALSKDPQKRFPDGAAFREAFLDAGRKGSADKGDRTLVDAVTVGVGVAAANLETRPGLDSRSTGGVVASKRSRRSRALGLALATGLVLAAGVATAAYIRLNRPAPLRAEDRQPRATHLPPPASEATDAPRERHEETTSKPKEAVVHDVEPAVTVPRMPRNIQLAVPAGADVHLSLDAPVGSASSHAGEVFTATITEPVVAGDRVAIPIGSKVHGRVVQATPAKKGLGDKAGSLTLAFDKVMTPFGFTASMSAGITRVAPKSTQKTAATIGGSAAGGALLGKVLGGKSKNAALGTLVGAAVGTGIAAGVKGEEVEFPAGSSLTVTLDRPITISVQP